MFRVLSLRVDFGNTDMSTCIHWPGAHTRHAWACALGPFFPLVPIDGVSLEKLPNLRPSQLHMLSGVPFGPFGTCLPTSIESCLFLLVICRHSAVNMLMMMVMMMTMYDAV